MSKYIPKLCFPTAERIAEIDYAKSIASQEFEALNRKARLQNATVFGGKIIEHSKLNDALDSSF